MSDTKRMKLSVNFNSLPPEMVERILKLLNLMELCQARLICKIWKEIIDKGNLVKDAAGNFLSCLSRMVSFFESSDFMYSESILILPLLLYCKAHLTQRLSNI